MNTGLLTPQIFTPRGFIKKNLLGDMHVLDIGCGKNKLPGALGMDRISDNNVDIVHDFSDFPWPFDDDFFDVVLLNSVLEHVPDVLKTMEEIYRISHDRARIVIKTPYFRSIDAFTDPTHYHYFTSHSLDYFLEDTELKLYGYSNIRFKKLGFWYGWPHPSSNFLKQFLKDFVRHHSHFYDQYLSLVLPVKCLFWELGVIKS